MRTIKKLDKKKIRLNKKNIRFKLIVGYVSLLLISMFLISGSVYIILRNSIRSKVTNYAESIIQQVSFNSRNKFDSVQSVYSDLEHLDFFTSLEKMKFTSDDYNRLIIINKLTSDISKESSFNKSIVALGVTDNKSLQIGIMPAFRTDAQTNLDKLINLAKVDKEKFYWINYSGSGKDNSNSRIYLLKTISEKATGNYLGTLMVEFDSTKISEIYSKINLGTGSGIFTVDKTGVLIGNGAKFEKDFMNKNFMTELMSNENKGNKNFEFMIDGHTNLIVYSKIAGSDIYNIATIPISGFTADSNSMQYLMVFIGLICFIISLIAAIIVQKSITVPLKRFVEYIKVVGKGDFTYRLEDNYKDEIAIINESFNGMLIKVAQLIGDVKDISKKVNSSAGNIDELANHSNIASEQVALTMGEITNGAIEQAQEVSKGVSIMENLAIGIQDITDSISESSTVIDKSKITIEGSLVTIKTLNDKSEETNKFSAEIIKEINELNDDMKEIKGITDIIMHISSQTNLLSLNAAIEAASAGEDGRGFSVVAGEVRRLAIQTKDSSIKINAIINEIKLRTEFTVEEANNSKDIVGEQKQAVSKTNKAFIDMNAAMQGVNIKIQNMKMAVNNILKLKNSTLDTIEGIAAVSEETSASTESVLESTQLQIATVHGLTDLIVQLLNLSKELSYSIEEFKLD